MDIKKYFCGICNYETVDLSNFFKHNKTKKHIEKSNQCTQNDPYDPKMIRNDPANDPEQVINATNDDSKYKCNGCDKSFTNATNYSRHKLHRCVALKDLSLMEENKKLKDENEKLKQNENDMLKKENEYYKSLVNKAGILADKNSDLAIKSMSALTYLMQAHPNAPLLELVDESRYEEMADPNYDLAFTMVHYFRKKRLHEYIGEHVIDFYYKENQEESFLWSSDVVRKTFLYRGVVNDEPDWIIDKVAGKIGKKIIDPMLSYIKTKLKKYNKEQNKLTQNNKLEVGEMGVYRNNNADGMSIISSIENGELKRNIIRIIAPKFYLNKALSLELEK